MLVPLEEKIRIASYEMHDHVQWYEKDISLKNTIIQNGYAFNIINENSIMYLYDRSICLYNYF